MAVAVANYKIIQGEGNVAGAEIGLGDSNGFALEVFCTKNRAEGTLDLYLTIFVDPKARVSREVGMLRKVPSDAKKNMDICINSRCRSQHWVHSDEGSDESGGPLTIENPVKIGIAHERIRSLGIVVPDDNGKYGFQGDVDGILNRICR
jgi:hypothetical protein